MAGAPTYNAAAELIGRNLAAGRGAKTAFVDDYGACSYADLAAGESVRRGDARPRHRPRAAHPAVPK